MPIIKKGTFISAILGICIFIVTACSSGDAYIADNIKSRLVTAEQPLASPSGKYSLEKREGEKEGVKGFWVSITDFESGEEIFTGDVFTRLRDTSFLFWEEKDVVWLYNGDTGTFFWKLDEGVWSKYSYATGDTSVEAPQLLKRLRPNIFK